MSRKELFLIFQLQPSKAHIQFRFLTCANRLLVERGEAKLDEPAGITTQVMAAPDRDVSGVFFEQMGTVEKPELGVAIGVECHRGSRETNAQPEFDVCFS